MAWLGQRELRNVIRDKAALIANTGGTLFLNVIVSCVFFAGARYNTLTVKESDTTDYSVMSQQAELQSKLGLKVSNHFGSIVQIAIGAMFGLAQPMILGFPVQRPVFLREYATGSYSAIPYFVSKLATEIPSMLVSSTMIFLATYWMIGFQGNFLFLVLSTTMVGMVAASYALCIGSVANNVNVAVQLVPLLFVPQLLFAGLFIAIKDIPIWLRWAQYLCSLKYSINIISTIEMQDLPHSLMENITDKMYYSAVYGCENVTNHKCDAGQDINEFSLFPRIANDPSLYYRDLAVLVAIFVGFRLLSCIVLTAKASGSR